MKWHSEVIKAVNLELTPLGLRTLLSLLIGRIHLSNKGCLIHFIYTFKKCLILQLHPDQMSRFVASDLGLHCLLWSHVVKARHKWVNPHLPSGLLHPYQLDESISNFRGGWGTFFIFILFLIEIPVSKQWRSCVLRRLIWVCTVCLCPQNWTLGLYGLRSTLTHWNVHHKNIL